MQVTLAGRVIVVTGAARGIGRAIAEQAAEAGAEALLLTDRDDCRADLAGARTAVVRADLADPGAPRAVAEAALEQFGRIDGMVNAAGLTTRGSFQDATQALWDRLFAVNARAPFFLMAEAIADMRRRKAPGSIVNVLSINAHCGAPDLAVYSATKAALQTLTRNAAQAHMAERIRVNGINLGWADTESERRLHAQVPDRGPDWLDRQAAMQPLGRLITAEETARLAVYLLSDASSPLSGACPDLEQRVMGANG